MTISTFHRVTLGLAMAGLAFGMTACSAGQVAQTSGKVAAVDGESITQEGLSIRDITVALDDTAKNALKFTIAWDPNSDQSITLNRVTVNGTDVSLTPRSGSMEITPGDSLFAASQKALDTDSKGAAGTPGIKYVVTDVSNADLYPGGQAEVVFYFDGLNKPVSVSAPISAVTLPAGESDRNKKGEITLDAPSEVDHSAH